MLTKPAFYFYRLMGFLCLVSASIACLCYLVFDYHVALAVLIGGLINIVANGVFVFTGFSAKGFASQANTILHRFYLAEGLKFLITLCLFALAIRWHLLFFPLLIVYFIVQVGFSFLAGSRVFLNTK